MLQMGLPFFYMKKGFFRCFPNYCISYNFPLHGEN